MQTCKSCALESKGGHESLPENSEYPAPEDGAVEEVEVWPDRRQRGQDSIHVDEGLDVLHGVCNANYGVRQVCLFNGLRFHFSFSSRCWCKNEPNKLSCKTPSHTLRDTHALGGWRTHMHKHEEGVALERRKLTGRDDWLKNCVMALGSALCI